MSEENPEITNQKVMEAVGELRKEFEKSQPDQEKTEKLEKILDAQEEINQKNLTETKAAEQRELDLKERIDTLEVEIARGGTGNEKNYKDSPEFKALNGLVTKGVEFMDQEQKQLLRTDNDTAGGYLVMGEMDTMITKRIEEVSAIRTIARVRSIASKSLEMPIRKGILVATFEGEADAGADSVSNYGSETLTPYRQTVGIPITEDLLQDANFNMESEILSDAAEAFAVGEGRGHVNGSGHKVPEGFLVNPDVIANARNSITSQTLEADDLILLTGDLKVGYNPSYVLNRKTLAFLRTLKSTTGQFLWQPGMNGPIANTINGYPYLSAIDMPDIAANSLSVAFGDFMRGYTIVDRTGVTIVRDNVTKAANGIVIFTVRRYTTGQVTLPEAIKVMKTLA